MDLVSFHIAVLTGYAVIHLPYNVKFSSWCTPHVAIPCAGSVVSIDVAGERHNLKPDYVPVDEI